MYLGAARNFISIVLVAGMSIGMLFTLLVIPSPYVLIAKQHAGEKQTPAGTKENPPGAN